MTTPADLAAELDASRLGLHAVDERIALVKKGVDLAILDAWPPIGVTRIERCGNTYQPCPGGELAYIIGEPSRNNDDLRYPEWLLVDLVAVPLADPSTMLTRCDLAYGLGAYNKAGAIAFGKPLVVHETLFDWLLYGRTGLLIIDHKRAGEMLSSVPQIVGQSLRHAQRLRELVRPPPAPMPEVLVSRSHLKEVRHG